jgi:membrane-associated protease RseP (regulator of RpoE activity)
VATAAAPFTRRADFMDPAQSSQPLAHDALPIRSDVDRATRARRGPALNIALFTATFVTTAMAGAINRGFNPFADFHVVVAGFPFAITVMTILLCHELGHYFLAQTHRVDATLPYFIPAPPFFLVGTFGAFIRMRTMPPNRRALFDIGAAGPWAGFVIAVPAVVVGLHLSEIRPLGPTEGGLLLGDSLLFSALTHLVLGVDSSQVTVLLHPVALAGWFGLLVTSLNLLPVGQLDGGHVAYAVFGRHHKWISRGVFAFVVVMGMGGWPGWLVWALLLLVLGLRHPRPFDPHTPLDRHRMIAAALTLVVFVLTFMPVPVDIVEPHPAPVFQGERIPISAPAAPHGLVVRL